MREEKGTPDETDAVASAAFSTEDWSVFWRGRDEAGFGTEELLPKHQLALNLLERLLSRETIRTVCDFGCGPGILLRHVRSRHHDLDLCGADFVDIARRHVTGMGLRYLPFDLRSDHLQEPFDVGMLVDVLEHFPDPVGVLRRLSGVRYLVIVVPNFSFLTERVSALLGRVPFQWRGRLHAHWFNVHTLEAMTASYRVIDRLESYPGKLSRLPFRTSISNLLATSLGIVIQLREKGTS